MKNFNYTGRNKNGGREEGVIQAESRVRVVAILSERGIVPLSITEKKGNGVRYRKLPFALQAVGLVLASLGVIALLVWLLWRQGVPSAQQRMIRDRKKTTQYSPGKGNKGLTAYADKLETVGEIGQAKSVRPGMVAPVNAGMETNAFVEYTGTETNRMFKGMTEQALSMIESVQPGMRIPPIPLRKGMEADFQQAMTNLIVIKETDSEQTAKHKEDVAWLKQDIAGLVKQGLTPEEAIREIEKFRKEQATLKQDFVKYVVELRKSGQHEEADAFIKEANVVLLKEGIVPLPETLGKERSK
jgi:hypothetical protein